MLSRLGPHPSPRRARAVTASFAHAVERHQAGALDAAERHYGAVLARAPDHAAALHGLGLVRAQRGDLAAAAALLERACRADPGTAEASNDLGAVLERLGRIDDAQRAFEAAVACAPGLLAARYNLGALLLAAGRVEAGLAALVALLALDPGHAAAHHRCGLALAQLGRDDAALTHCEQALALNPAAPELYAWIGVLRMRLGRFAAAADAFGAALMHQPQLAALHANLGAAHAALERHDAAAACFARALALEPDLAEAHNGLGNAAQCLGRLDAAIAHYRDALALRPDYVDAYNNLAVALIEAGRHDAARVACWAALALAPNSIEGHNNLGTALAGLGREEAALACYDRVLAGNPAHVGALINAGNALKTLGRLDAARVALERAATLEPRARHYFHLAESRRFVAGDPFLAAMEGLAADDAALTERDRIHLHFARANAYADLGDAARAFEQLQRGNALRRRSVDYDEAAILDGFARVVTVFTPDLFAAHAGVGAPSPRPVFVVGMPRSGTTLVEQILASHPDVFGAGELELFPRAVAATCVAHPDTAFPELVAALDGAALGALGARYLAGVERLAPPEAARVTDKLPLNFVHVGLIHLALPGARIVHVRRDPLDTCLSCYAKLFAGNQPFAYDLGELGRYYCGYASVMAHWRRVLPAGVLLELSYEAVVADLETAARRLVAHCGLAWNDACLAFHRTERPVRTASALQVRRPLYTEAIGRAAAYAPWLAPLIAALS